MNPYIIKARAIWNDEGEQETVFDIWSNDGDPNTIYDGASAEVAERYFRANERDARCEA